MTCPAVREEVAQALHRRDRHLAIMRGEEARCPTWTLMPEDQRESYRLEADAAIAAILHTVPGVEINFVRVGGLK